MEQYGVSKDYTMYQRKLKISTIISLAAFFASIFIFIIPQVTRDHSTFLDIVGMFITLMLMMPAIIYGERFLIIKKYKNIVGENLSYDISELGIQIFDEVDGIKIEKEFKWSDIDYIHKVCYSSYATVGKYFYGLEFVMNESKFHEALSKRQKKAEYHQRDEELNHGFFILCDRDYWDTVEGYYGKEIR